MKKVNRTLTVYLNKSNMLFLLLVEDEENNENEEDSYSITSKGYFDDNMLSNRNVEKRAAAFTGKHSTNSSSKSKCLL